MRKKKISAYSDIADKQITLTQERDDSILSAWRKAKAKGTLLALGGYGRGELFPYSDIDLLIIDTTTGKDTEKHQKFVQLLWDQGLNVGHSVRQLEQCLTDAQQDTHFYTSLLEARALTDKKAILPALQKTLHQESYHPFAAFYQEKCGEQLARHDRFANNLQPNIKKCPGGLRDLHVIRWLALRYYQDGSLTAWHQRGHMNAQEFDYLQEAFSLLQSIRFALHSLAGRAEDRLLFEYQKTLAKTFGFRDTDKQLAVEHFMQAFYRATRRIEVINEMIVQQAAEFLVINDAPTAIDQDFQIRFNQLDVIDDDSFQHNPTLLLKAFVELGKNSDAQGFSARTIRLIQKALPLIDNTFRTNPKHHRLFLSLFELQHGIYHQCTKIIYYQVLQHYLPEFEVIVGQMQFDLYHVYTVDIHTLKVIGQCRKLALGELADTLPEATQIFQKLDDPKLLYLAALYHDVGKGRGVDHSQWGAQAVRAFATQHGLPERDIELLGWLVEHHLTLSLTAQKTDITDSTVIARFAQRMKDQRHLDYLYLLTICDMRGTNMSLWNGWKHSLLHSLHTATLRYLSSQHTQQNDDNIIDIAWRTLPHDQQAKLKSIWPLATQLYAETLTEETLQWRVSTLLASPFPHSPCLAIRPNPDHGEWELFFAIPRMPYIYTRITHTLETLNLDILDAQGQSTDTLVCGQFVITEPAQVQEVERAIQMALTDEMLPKRLKKRKKAEHASFDIPPHVAIEPAGTQYKISVRTRNRHGLLADICQLLTYYQLRIHKMRISTLGEKVEDSFWVQPERPVNWQKINKKLLEVCNRQ